MLFMMHTTARVNRKELPAKKALDAEGSWQLPYGDSYGRLLYCDNYLRRSLTTMLAQEYLYPIVASGSLASAAIRCLVPDS